MIVDPWKTIFIVLSGAILWMPMRDVARRYGYGLAVLLFAIALAVFTQGAAAHSWYPDKCCHDRDCWHVEVSDDWIRETAEGVIWIPTGRLYKWGDGAIKWDQRAGDHYHVCTPMGRVGRTKKDEPFCIFPPARSA